jgi:hypothetical protein
MPRTLPQAFLLSTAESRSFHFNVNTTMVHQVLGIWILSVLSSGSAFVLKPSRDSYHNSFASFDRQRISTRMAAQPTASKGTSVEQETLKQVLAVAIEASKKAGDIILGNAGGAEVTKSKANSRDLLTLIDPLCEKVRDNVDRDPC